MTELPINTHICEINGPHYEVQLWSIPRVGELIDLFSMADLQSKHEPSHLYKVVQIIHKIRDVTGKTDPPSKGQHFVEVWVSPQASGGDSTAPR